MSEENELDKPEFKFTTEFVTTKLERFHDPKDWAFFEELRLGTGFGKDSEQRFDAWAIHYLKGQRNVSRCYEVKVSRSDFFSEIKKPKKRKAGLRLSNEFYFVTPKNLLKVEEIPPECGLMEVDEHGEVHIKIPAPFRDTWPCTWQFVATICKRLDTARRKEAEYEERIKRAVFARDAETRSVLDRHLKKWQDHKIGSREIPDKILDALEDIKSDVDAAMQYNRTYR